MTEEFYCMLKSLGFETTDRVKKQHYDYIMLNAKNVVLFRYTGNKNFTSIKAKFLLSID